MLWASPSLRTPCTPTPEYDFVEYLEVVTASLQTGPTGAACTNAISTAVAQIQNLTTSAGGLAQLASNFSLCAAPNTSLDIANFM